MTKLKFIVRQRREQKKEKRASSEFSPISELLQSKDFRRCRKRFTHDFFERYLMGYRNYIAGNWPVARWAFEYTKAYFPEGDGPSEVLLRYMEAQNYEAVRWAGFRELHEK